MTASNGTVLPPENEMTLDPFDEDVPAGDPLCIRRDKVTPCGAKDPAARVLEPVHYDCDTCKAALRIMSWKPPVRHRRTVVQTSMPEDKRRKNATRAVCPDSFDLDSLPSPD